LALRERVLRRAWRVIWEGVMYGFVSGVIELLKVFLLMSVIGYSIKNNAFSRWIFPEILAASMFFAARIFDDGSLILLNAAAIVFFLFVAVTGKNKFISTLISFIAITVFDQSIWGMISLFRPDLHSLEAFDFTTIMVDSILILPLLALFVRSRFDRRNIVHNFVY
jgi:hypothetical protein